MPAYCRESRFSCLLIAGLLVRGNIKFPGQDDEPRLTCRISLYCHMSAMIYLDNSATTRVRDEVIEAMSPYLTEKFGNPSSIHKLGRLSRQAVDAARQQVAALINASPEEIYFAPCGTYSNNVAIAGRARFVEANGLGRHLITCLIEHASSLGPARALEARGWRITYLQVDAQGFVDAEELRAAITPETSIVSLMWANNEVGTVLPVEDLSAVAKERGVFFHTDAIQVAGKLPIDVTAVPVDTLSLSGHKFYAPKGIGALYVRKGVNLMPIVFGGGQEMSLFPGTEGLTNIVGIGKAAELARLEQDSSRQGLTSMQKILIDKLTAVDGVRLTGASDLSRRLPGHVSLVVEGAVGEELVEKADAQGVCISSVSACSQSGGDPSHVLSAIGLPKEAVLGSARLTAGRFNSEQECLKAADILSEIVSAQKSRKVLRQR